MKQFCENCRKDVTYTIKNKVRQKEVENKIYTYDVKEAYCNKCGSEIYIGELADNNLKHLNAIVGRKDVIETLEENFTEVSNGIYKNKDLFGFRR